MSAKAYVLMETMVGKTRDVAKTLRGVEGIKEADVVMGPWDVIAIINDAEIPVIGALVVDRIHTIPGVVRTLTCMADSNKA